MLEVVARSLARLWAVPALAPLAHSRSLSTGSRTSAAACCTSTRAPQPRTCTPTRPPTSPSPSSASSTPAPPFRLVHARRDSLRPRTRAADRSRAGAQLSPISRGGGEGLRMARLASLDEEAKGRGRWDCRHSRSGDWRIAVIQPDRAGRKCLPRCRLLLPSSPRRSPPPPPGDESASHASEPFVRLRLSRACCRDRSGLAGRPTCAGTSAGGVRSGQEHVRLSTTRGPRADPPPLSSSASLAQKPERSLGSSCRASRR